MTPAEFAEVLVEAGWDTETATTVTAGFVARAQAAGDGQVEIELSRAGQLFARAIIDVPPPQPEPATVGDIPFGARLRWQIMRAIVYVPATLAALAVTPWGPAKLVAAAVATRVASNQFERVIPRPGC